MMADKPLVSILTGTIPERHDLLMEAIENVRAQTYPNLEHVIVSDGPDPELAKLIEAYDWPEGRNVRVDDLLEPIAGPSKYPRFVSTRFVELGRHWSKDLTDSMSAVPFQVAQWMARGDYHILWADDERATPDHITNLVDLLEATGADFAYSKTRMYWKGSTPAEGWDIGTDPPRYGQITNLLYRTSMIDKAGGPMRTHVGSATDWEFVGRAISGGATWAFLPEVTFEHRADK